MSLDYDRDEDKKSKGDNLRASLTFGKFNSSLPSSSIEVVDVDKETRRAYMVRSSGLKLHDKEFKLPYNSFVNIEPFLGNNGLYTESEARFNESRAKFADLWKNLTMNDTHKFTWVNNSNMDSETSAAFFPKVKCEIVNSTILQALN